MNIKSRPPDTFGLMNFNRFVLKKCPHINIRRRGIRIDIKPNFPVRSELTLKSSLPFDPAEKFFINENVKTRAEATIKNPNILNIVCLFILNLKNGSLTKDFRLAIFMNCNENLPQNQLDSLTLGKFIEIS